MYLDRVVLVADEDQCVAGGLKGVLSRVTRLHCAETASFEISRGVAEHHVYGDERSLTSSMIYISIIALCFVWWLLMIVGNSQRDISTPTKGIMCSVWTGLLMVVRGWSPCRSASGRRASHRAGRAPTTPASEHQTKHV